MITKGNLIRHMMNWNPTLVEQMKQTNHHFDQKNLSPYHMEGDVWTHTMLVLNNSTNNAPIDLIAAMCHDLGKPRACRRRDEKKKVTFYNHANASVQYTIDFMYYLKDNMSISNEEWEAMLKNIVLAVSNHLDVFEIKPSDMCRYLNFSNQQKQVLMTLVNADKNGQLRDPIISDNFDKYGGVSIWEFLNDLVIPKHEILSIDDCKYVIMSGAPGVGKDYIAETMLEDPLILSFDDIRMKLYREKYPDDKREECDIYTDAFVFSKDINLNNKLVDQLKSAVDHPGHIVISNTSCNKKARRKLINLIKNVDKESPTIASMHIIAPYETLVSRDKMRTDNGHKSVGADIVNIFAYNQAMPTMAEGFERCEIIIND